MTIQVPEDKFGKGKTLPGTPAADDSPAHKMSGQNLATLQGLAALHMSYGQVQNAEKFLRIALWAAPNDAKSQRLMAHVYARLGQPKKAVDLMLAASKSPHVKLRMEDWKEIGLAFVRQSNLRVGLKLLARG